MLRGIGVSEQRAAFRTATAGSRAVSLAALGSVPRAGSGWVPVATAARVAAAAAAVGAMTSTMAVSASVLTMRSATVSTWSGGGAASGLTGPQPPRTKANFGVVMVPQQEAWVVERFQAYWQVLKPGLHLLVPFMHRVAYVHSLKQVAVAISDQRAITKDNVQLHVDGVLYYQINDPYAASYNIEDPNYAVRQLAESTMRAELGKMTLDRTFEEREALNANIVEAINSASAEWGVLCRRYEIRDISPPMTVISAMELQVAAERQKRARVLESEGFKQSDINIADGKRQAKILASEAEMQELINTAAGEAEAIIRRAEATAQEIKEVAAAMARSRGADAVNLKVAEQYIHAFEKLAKTNNTILMPSNMGDTSSMVASALSVYNSVNQANGGGVAGSTEQGEQGKGGEDGSDSSETTPRRERLPVSSVGSSIGSGVSVFDGVESVTIGATAGSGSLGGLESTDQLLKPDDDVALDQAVANPGVDDPQVGATGSAAGKAGDETGSGDRPLDVSSLSKTNV